MVDYVKLAATAQRLIEKNGREVTVQDKGAAVSANAWEGLSDAGTVGSGNDDADRPGDHVVRVA